MIFRILTLVLLLLPGHIVLAKITVSVDHSPVVADESFRLIFESDRKITTKPDFSPLNKEFTVLNSSQRSHTKIVNGDISYSQQWILTMITNKTGIIGIPSIRFGKELSKPQSIKVIASTPVTKNKKTDDIFIDVSVNTDSPYVQAQIVYKVKLYRAVVTDNASLSEPKISGGQVVIERLGEDKSYETRKNGKRYVVIERQYAIFPQVSGELNIEPIVFQGQTGGGGFFNFDPFGPQPKSIAKRSGKIKLNVKQIPDSFTGDTWLPASELNIQEQWSIDPGKLKLGEATTRTLSVRASGLAASQLPAINGSLPKELKQYPDQPKFEELLASSGLIGLRQEKMAIIPTEGGKYLLPAIKIPWWNTSKDKMEIAELPERYIQVDATATGNIEDQNTSPEPENEFVAIENNNTKVDSAIDTQTFSTLPNWQWVSTGLFILWLLTVFMWWRSGNKNDTKKEKVNSADKTGDYLKKLRQSCKRNDPHITKDNLLLWARANWPDANINSIGQIKKFNDVDIHNVLDDLNNHLYGKATGQWNGAELLNMIEKIAKQKKNKAEPIGKLEPLYRT